MRTRRAMGRRVAKRPVQWIAKQAAAASDTWAGLTTRATVAATLTQLGPLVSSADGASGGIVSIDRFRVERIRGQVSLFGLAADYALPGAVSMGIYVGDFVGGSLVDLWDPTRANDGEKSWLWLWSGVVSPPSFAQSVVNLNVDVKVKRILRSNQELVMALKTTNVTQYLVNLRTLVSRAI